MSVDEALARVDNPDSCVDELHRTLAAKVRRLREQVATQERITERALAANVEQRAEVRELQAERDTWQSSAREWESYAKRRDAELDRVRRLLDDEDRHRVRMDGNWVKWSDIADALDGAP